MNYQDFGVGFSTADYPGGGPVTHTIKLFAASVAFIGITLAAQTARADEVRLNPRARLKNYDSIRGREVMRVTFDDDLDRRRRMAERRLTEGEYRYGRKKILGVEE